MKKLMFCLFIFIFILLFSSINYAFVLPPQEVLEQAAALTRYNNYVILQHKVTKEYYIPYPTSVSDDNAWSSWIWHYAYYNGRSGLIDPDWYYMGLKVYRNNSFVDVNINDFGSNTMISLDNLDIVYSTRNINYRNYPNHSNSDVYFYATLPPSITTSSSNVVKWNFDKLTIDGGFLENITFNNDINQFLLETSYNGITYMLDINSYKVVNGNHVTFNIPRNFLLNGAVIRTDENVSFVIVYTQFLEGGSNILDFNLGSYTFDLNATEEEEVQQDQSQALLGNINDNINNTNNSLNSIESSITDSTIDSEWNLPSDSTTDITLNGINTIFTSMYNAFCSSTAQNIVLPLPYMNKSITIDPYFLENLLTSNTSFSLVYSIIQAFWGYIICSFIVKDIMKKINKIKSGNIENIETENIKGELL